MSSLEEATTSELCEFLVRRTYGIPVRLMETILDRGDEAVEPLLGTLDRALDQALAEVEAWEATGSDGSDEGWDGDEGDDRLTPVWPLVLLGLLGNPAAVPALVDAVRRAARAPFETPLAAAEALARIGREALPALKELARDPDPACRIWAYGAMGWIPDREAYVFLTDTLSTDADCLDAVADALNQHGRPEAIPLLYEALQRAEPWQRMEIQGAIQDLHAGDRPEPFDDHDWRLRYRPEPAIGAMPPAWPVISVMVREEGLTAESPDIPVRPLSEILDEAREAAADVALCECCEVPVFEGAGVSVCPATAVAVTMLQRELLGRYREEDEIEDLFELLTEVEFEAMDLYHWEPEPRGRRARERRDDRLVELRIVRGACRWLIQQGVESIGGGRATLLAEALRLAQEHGDPNDFFQDPVPARTSGPQVGRNEPCPCGSGRKFKKCCGHPSRAGAPASSPAAGARGPVAPRRGMPQLVTFDGEAVSFGRARYRMTDPAAVREALEGCPELDEDPDDGSFAWSRRIRDDEWRLLGSIHLEGDKLTLECMSDERLAGGKALLAELAGEHLVHRADTTQDPWQAVEEARESGTFRRARESPEALPPEVAAEAIQDILNRHYATWADEPLPALDGRTARECMETPGGREEVADLLRSMEEMEARKPSHQRYDFGKLWTELGIEELR